ncbi:uncharacterized protein [Gossypium hirsutum]|uniref:Uncharacterized protein n=1 Tax=Gossypium hirsutum TaxID=3635 RepID=A0ABM3BA46_GOSHI|nr:uncharacterized protein LOC107942857 [Gossypium hirsutum]
MDDLDCTSEQKLKGAVSLLRDEAYQWWLTVREEFLRLNRYARGIGATEYERYVRFEDGLRNELRFLIAPQKERDFAVLVEKAKITEDVKRSEHQNREKDKGRFKRDSEPSSSSRRPKKKVKCGSREHQVKDCPQRPTQIQSTGQGFVQPVRGAQQPPRGCGQVRGGNGVERDHGALGRDVGNIKARQPALVYGSTHSYIACTVSGTLGIMCEGTANEMTVLSPLRQSVRVDKLFRDVPLETIEDEEVAVIGERRDFLSNVISALRAQKLVRMGCEAFLAYVGVSDSEGPFVGDIKTVKDFFDVFPDELSRLPPSHEVEFRIELLPETAPVSIATYRMAPKELVELKSQIQELLDRRFIRPNVSP